MTTAALTNPVFSYFSNLINAADNFVGAVIFLKPSALVDSFIKARAVSRVVAQGRPVSPRQLQKIHKMMGLEPVTE